MKTISTLFALILVTAIGQAQTVYNVTKNRNWKDNYPSSCTNCTFNISPGVTLLIDRDVNLKNVTFNGGTVIVSDYSLNLSSSGGKSNNFNNTQFILNKSSSIAGSAPIIIKNSDFTFNGSSNFIPRQLLDLTNSHLNFNEDSYLLAAGSNVQVKLRSNSLVVVGDGTMGSEAKMIFFLGPQLTLFDNSTVIIANNNNYYFNGAPYYAAATDQWINTWNVGLNCGSTFPNGCALSHVFGPASLLPSGVSGGNILPVVLSDFSVRLSNNRAELSWVTDQENNSARFEVERSIDGANWITIGTIAAKGNSNTPGKYAFTDKSPAAGVNHYRLKMVDLDNTYNFSAIKSVRAAASVNIRAYPNPAKGSVNVSLPASASSVRLLNTAGQILQERKNITGNSTISLDVSSYTAGTYLVQVMKTDGTSSNAVLVIAQ